MIFLLEIYLCSIIQIKNDLFLHLDINECTLGTHQCNVNADCTNTDGGYTCACQIGFSGDGFECSGIIFV